jgi:hypothetical protein
MIEQEDWREADQNHEGREGVALAPWRRWGRARALTSALRRDFQAFVWRLWRHNRTLAMTRRVSKTTSKSLAAVKGGATH